MKLDRRNIQLQIEQKALKKETDSASKERLHKLEQELTVLDEKQKCLNFNLAATKGTLQQTRNLKTSWMLYVLNLKTHNAKEI